MSKIRYLLDENVDPLLHTELLNREPELVAWRIGDPLAPPYGTLDPAILQWCEENSFVLVTNKRKSIPRHLHDHVSGDQHVPGIIELNPKMSIGETIEELLMIWGVSDIDDYWDLLIYLPLS